MPKKILIIYPHWPPSNLAGVHRARLIANFLPEFGWEPSILTVSPEFYEEALDPDLCRTVADHVKVHETKAFGVGRVRIVGDIGLRGFFQLRTAALKLIKEERPDFIWIPIPSFYTAILARLLHRKTGVPYGVDYIDPWVRPLHPSQRKFSRAGLSLLIAKMLEPFAVRKASLISGVSRPYYKPVLERNFQNRSVVDVAMPYGFDPNDHQLEPTDQTLLWDDKTDAWIYAGAFLPKSAMFFHSLFRSIQKRRTDGNWPPNIRLYFVGTGPYPGEGITELAEQYGLADIVEEHRDRFPFLRVQRFLRNASRVLLIGSVDKHYTASKTFQCVLSGRPVFAMLHHESTATEFLQESQADNYLACYVPEDSEDALHAKTEACLQRLLTETDTDWDPDTDKLAVHSSRESARVLVGGVEDALEQQR